MSEIDTLSISGFALRLTCSLVPWDTDAFAFPVAQISHIETGDVSRAKSEYVELRDWLARARVRVVSCRLPHDHLRESMFLESEGFRFVEMVLHPRVIDLQRFDGPGQALSVVAAAADDLPALEAIAFSAFQNERYHVDPRLDPTRGCLRYSRWVRSSLDHPTQKLLKVLDGVRLVAFFIVEARGDMVYWHLTAVAPEWQGQGYGKRAWQTMLARHCAEGAHGVSTTVSARNTRVLSLYATLGFHFLPPEMTFHWVREE